MAHAIRRTARLSFGRRSEPGASYFVTFCTSTRVPVLMEAEVAGTLKDVLVSMNAQQDIELIAATIMPDHVHLLFGLGERLSVGQILGKMKALSRRGVQAGWQWQKDSFEHRVRLHDVIEDYGFYVFMNPYRAGLCPLDQRWPWWICPDPQRLRFLSLIEDDQVVPVEWCERSRMIGAALGIGARRGPPASGGPTQGNRS